MNLLHGWVSTVHKHGELLLSRWRCIFFSRFWMVDPIFWVLSSDTPTKRIILTSTLLHFLQKTAYLFLRRLTKPAQNTLSAVSPGLYITALNPLLHWGQFTIEFPVTAHNVNFQFYRPQVSLNTNTFKPHTIKKIPYVVLKNKNGWFYMFPHYILFTAYFYPFEVITLNAHWI